MYGQEIWDEITNLFPNLNGCTVEVLELMEWFDLTLYSDYIYVFIE